MRCLCGYLCGAMCRLFVYCPADATAFSNPHRLLFHFNPAGTQVVLEKRPSNGWRSSSSFFRRLRVTVHMFIKSRATVDSGHIRNTVFRVYPYEISRFFLCYRYATVMAIRLHEKYRVPFARTSKFKKLVLIHSLRSYQ